MWHWSWKGWSPRKFSNTRNISITSRPIYYPSMSIGARLSWIKEILMADPAASGHPVMTLPPSYPPGSPFLFLSSRWWGRSFVCLPHKSHRIRNLPSLSLIFAQGTRGRKPLIYALPDRSIVRSFVRRKFEVWSPKSKAGITLSPVATLKTDKTGEREQGWSGKCKLEKKKFV